MTTIASGATNPLLAGAEALERYLDEREDLELALARLRDPEAEWLDHAEARRELGLD